MKFWDSSALVSLLVQDTFSSRMTGVWRKDPVMVVWWGTPVECVSALSRLERQGDLAPSAVTAALDRLRRLQQAWHEVEPSVVVRETAERLLRIHPLRAADSLQLAAAIIAVDHRPSRMQFVCNDDRLAGAAEREGFTVVSG